MKIKYKNTDVDIKMFPTDLKIGLSDNDYWCRTYIVIDNDEFHYEVARESITKNESTEALEQVKDFYNGKIKTLRIVFIKNIIKIFLVRKNGKKTFELRLVSVVGKKNKQYSLFFEDDEIANFIKMIEKSHKNINKNTKKEQFL